METITIAGIEYNLNSDGTGLFVDFNQGEKYFKDHRLNPNGLPKRIRFETLTLRKNWQITTEVVVWSVTPSGLEIEPKKIPQYTSTAEDANVFKQYGGTLISAGVFNGIFRFVLKVTKAVKQLDGSLVPEEAQPIPIPEEIVTEEIPE